MVGPLVGRLGGLDVDGVEVGVGVGVGFGVGLGAGDSRTELGEYDGRGFGFGVAGGFVSGTRVTLGCATGATLALGSCTRSLAIRTGGAGG